MDLDMHNMMSFEPNLDLPYLGDLVTGTLSSKKHHKHALFHLVSTGRILEAQQKSMSLTAALCKSSELNFFSLIYCLKQNERQRH